MAFGELVDYAQLVKQYGSDQERGPENRYSPYKVTGVERRRIMGQPDLDRVSGTSLDKGVELDALGKMSARQREALIQRAAAGEKVSAVQSEKRKAAPAPAYHRKT